MSGIEAAGAPSRQQSLSPATAKVFDRALDAATLPMVIGMLPLGDKPDSADKVVCWPVNFLGSGVSAIALAATSVAGLATGVLSAVVAVAARPCNRRLSIKAKNVAGESFAWTGTLAYLSANVVANAFIPGYVTR